MTDAVPPERADPLAVGDDSVTPRPRDDLVAGLMEARDCPRPAAERYLAEHGPEHAERVLLARWTS